MRNFFKSILVLLVLLGGLFASEQKAIIIFDASGSMWGQIKGVPKITIAKNALKKVVKSWNPDIQLGLTVYGHRRKGDCNDIQSVVPVGAVDKSRIIKSVMAISPKGKTPISRAIKRAADELKYTEDKATIILISDGKETCDPDPCATAKELKKQGIDFVAHVIGFNVDKTTDKQLACIAHATGGEYFSAKNADALNKAIKKVVKKVEKKPVDTTLVPVVRYNMSPNGLNISGVELTVTQNTTAIYSGKDEAPEVKAKVGNIDIKAKYARASIAQNIEQNFALKAKKKNVVKLLLKSGEATIDAAEQEGGAKVKASVHIYPVINGEANMDDEIAWCVPTQSKACVRVLPIGEYLLTATYSSMKTKKSFSIKNKERKKIHIYFKQTGKVYATARESEGGKLIDASCLLYNEDKSDSWHLSSRRKNPQNNTLQLPVGKYTANCSYNEFDKKDIPFEIKAGETTHFDVVFGQTGKVYVTARETEDGKLVYSDCRLYNEDKSDSWHLSSRRKNPQNNTLQLPVGKYTANCSYNAFEKKDIPVEVKAGETVHFDVVFAPFHVNAKGIAPCTKIHFEVISSDGETVYEKDSPAYKGIEFIASKGKYTIESSFGDKKVKTKIDIGKGQNSVTVDFGGDDTLNGIEGVWKTNEGRATIALNGKKVHGYYSNDNGELIGEMTYPKRFEGYWIEDNSNEKCSATKNGRYYWGKVVWKFDDKMCSFKGKWSYCNKTPNRSWRGSYIHPLSDYDKHKLLIKDDVSSNSKAENKTAPKEESQNSKETNKNNPKTIKIGDKVINIENLSDEQIKKLKDMQKMLEMFGKKQ